MQPTKNIPPILLAFFMAWTLPAQDTMRITIMQVHNIMAFEAVTPRDTFSTLALNGLYNFVERHHQGITTLELRGMCFFQARENDTYQQKLDEATANKLIWEKWASVSTRAAARLPELRALQYGILVSGNYGNTEVDFTKPVNPDALKKNLFDKLKAVKHASFYKLKTPLRTLQIQPFFIARSTAD
ncbi:MAG: hypothetical protein R3D58_12720 [Saprospiraceae bacterium]